MDQFNTTGSRNLNNTEKTFFFAHTIGQDTLSIKGTELYLIIKITLIPVSPLLFLRLLLLVRFAGFVQSLSLGCHFVRLKEREN